MTRKDREETAVDISNAQIVPRGAYTETLEKIKNEGHCPFCRENLFKHHTEPIITETANWIVTRNFAPYKGSIHQFLIISTPHIERIEDVSLEAEHELFTHYRMLAQKFNFSGATIVWRSGNTKMTGASVIHLHLQIIVGEERGAESEPISALVGFGRQT